MRASTIVLLSLLCISALYPLCSRADTIYLKNGRTIWADQVRLTETHVEYSVGEDSYAIPKSSVDHVDAGGLPPQYGTHAVSAQHGLRIPTFEPSQNEPESIGITDKIIVHGTLDAESLAELEKSGNPKLSAAADYVAGKFAYDRGNFGDARGYFEKALHADAENPAILNYYAALLVRTGNAGDALTYARKAVALAPDSADTHAVLGYAEFASDHGHDAIASWKRSLELRPDANLQAMLEKAQREANTETDFSQRESSHFVLRYEGKQTSEALRNQILQILDSDFEELSGKFGVSPRNAISVSLYTNQAFFDVTQAPSWTGAVNDGKLRIPVQGLNLVTPELAHVLKHELAHSFINQLSSGRCPQWLNEGIAQAMEPKSIPNGRRLAELFRAQHEIPFNALEGSFMGLSGVEANLAYDESLAAADYIIGTYGMSDLQRILSNLGQGSSTEPALRSVIHCSYAQFEDEVGRYLTAKYGD